MYNDFYNIIQVKFSLTRMKQAPIYFHSNHTTNINWLTVVTRTSKSGLNTSKCGRVHAFQWSKSSWDEIWLSPLYLKDLEILLKLKRTRNNQNNHCLDLVSKTVSLKSQLIKFLGFSKALHFLFTPSNQQNLLCHPNREITDFTQNSTSNQTFFISGNELISIFKPHNENDYKKERVLLKKSKIILSCKSSNNNNHFNNATINYYFICCSKRKHW